MRDGPRIRPTDHNYSANNNERFVLDPPGHDPRPRTYVCSYACKDVRVDATIYESAIDGQLSVNLSVAGKRETNLSRLAAKRDESRGESLKIR